MRKLFLLSALLIASLAVPTAGFAAIEGSFDASVKGTFLSSKYKKSKKGKKLAKKNKKNFGFTQNPAQVKVNLGIQATSDGSAVGNVLGSIKELKVKSTGLKFYKPKQLDLAECDEPTAEANECDDPLAEFDLALQVPELFSSSIDVQVGVFNAEGKVGKNGNIVISAHVPLLNFTGAMTGTLKKNEIVFDLEQFTAAVGGILGGQGGAFTLNLEGSGTLGSTKKGSAWIAADKCTNGEIQIQTVIPGIVDNKLAASCKTK